MCRSWVLPPIGASRACQQLLKCHSGFLNHPRAGRLSGPLDLWCLLVPAVDMTPAYIAGNGTTCPQFGSIVPTSREFPVRPAPTKPSGHWRQASKAQSLNNLHGHFETLNNSDITEYWIAQSTPEQHFLNEPTLSQTLCGRIELCLLIRVFEVSYTVRVAFLSAVSTLKAMYLPIPSEFADLSYLTKACDDMPQSLPILQVDHRSKALFSPCRTFDGSCLVLK